MSGQSLRDALEKLTYASDDGTEYEHNPGCEGEAECPACWVGGIRDALAAHPVAPRPVNDRETLVEALRNVGGFTPHEVHGFDSSCPICQGNPEAVADAVLALLNGSES